MRDGACPLVAVVAHRPQLAWLPWAAGLAFLAGCVPCSFVVHDPSPVPAASSDIQLTSCVMDSQPGEAIPLDLQATLRLTYQGNALIRQDREEARQYCESKKISSCLCGRKIKAQTECLRKQLDLVNTTTDTLRDAGNTYFDLLAARTLEATFRDLEEQRADLVERARKLAQVEPGARGQMKGLEARATGLKHGLRQLHQQGDSALIKLTYLLGLDACAHLRVQDSQLTRVELVADRPVCSLVEEALAQGPGVREMRQLVALADSSLGQARNSCKQLPGVDPCVQGTCCCLGGPGGCQSCFSLLSPFQTCEQLRVAQSRDSQVHLSYEDLRGKLTAGVRQAHAVIAAGREQLPLLEQTIDLAREGYTLTRKRFTEHLSNTNATQVSMTLDSLQDAYRSYVETINNYNKAQLQLLLLLGYPGCQGGGPMPAGLPVASTEVQEPDTSAKK